MKLGDLVEDLAFVFEGNEAVRATFRHVERAAILRRKRLSVPTEIAGRVRSKVHDDVVDRSSRAADELDLGVRLRLIVKAAQRSRQVVERDARLYERSGKPALGEIANAPGTSEEAALVGVRLGLDDPRSADRNRRETHRHTIEIAGSGT